MYLLTCLPKKSMSISTGGSAKMDAPAAVLLTSGAAVARANARMCASSCALSSTTSCLCGCALKKCALMNHHLTRQKPHTHRVPSSVDACTGMVVQHAFKSAADAAMSAGSRNNQGACWSSGSKLPDCDPSARGGNAAHCADRVKG